MYIVLPTYSCRIKLYEIFSLAFFFVSSWERTLSRKVGLEKHATKKTVELPRKSKEHQKTIETRRAATIWHRISSSRTCSSENCFLFVLQFFLVFSRASAETILPKRSRVLGQKAYTGNVRTRARARKRQGKSGKHGKVKDTRGILCGLDRIDLKLALL